tara:strand:- start:297 stop:683 length:387 start_codon:yes stop_codon:yes gene_type:complete
MENKKISFGKVLLKSLKVIIVQPLTLPLKIYKNTLAELSNTDKEGSIENTLSSDFPLYVWFISYYEALIALTYPLGIIIALLISIEEGEMFLPIIISTYFIPLFLGLIKELGSIALRNLFYLKSISNK